MSGCLPWPGRHPLTVCAIAQGILRPCLLTIATVERYRCLAYAAAALEHVTHIEDVVAGPYGVKAWLLGLGCQADNGLDIFNALIIG